ncbi:GNAT family N-acetyltransferase [Polaribacter sargassicola]|uniref:GNAT family N-acetyltransferase n=1 Tax=Polaribacter sargassicola TaxID=2836891 RepID=UPI001F3F8F86|nr:GNAT family N-acetyltransferase [Polaribacter sp. DS7-9]MCG1037155.1 GNAT family N-acetyltransferase [Polaribacter sp. DS7-9]
MTSKDFIIREIKPKDNAEMAIVIREVILEMGAPKIGTAYEDKATDLMFENFNKPTSFYYVIEHKNKVVGGAGIAKLDNFDGNICELQKMYFLPVIRGKGLGSKLIETCLQQAKTLGYKSCYLETMPYMEAAKTLYKKNGFTNLDKPMGNTGHYSCSVWMIKKL